MTPSKSRPRVLLLHFTTPAVLGGVEKVMGTHAAGLLAAGADVAIVAGRGAAGPRGVEVVRIPELDSRHGAVIDVGAALRRGDVPEGYAVLRDRIEHALRPHVERADRVVVHNALTLHKNHALAAAIERLAQRRPDTFIHWTHDLGWTDAQYAGELHDGEPWDRFRRPVTNVRYVAVSGGRRDEMCALLGLHQDEVSVVVNGVDMPAVLGLSAAGARLAERLGLYDADPLLLLPARLTRRKRVEAAIAATGALRESGVAAQLLVTGGPGAHNPTNRRYLAELRKLAATVEGTHLLYALGVRPTDRLVADLYALADCVVLPTANEGFGIPVVEAALHRLPIVCTDLPALRELAGADATYLAPDAGGPAIATAITTRLDGDPEARLRSRAKRLAWPRVLRERVVPVILEGAA